MEKFTCSTLIPIYLTSFLSTAAFSMIAPIFPNEAFKKGMSSTMAGLIFSTFGVSYMITSATSGKLVPKLGVKVIYITGLFLIGMTNIIFGILIHINHYSIFVIACIVTRMFEGIAVGLLGPSSFFIVVRQCNIFGNLEAFGSTGFTFGFIFGGVIYSFFGFTIPFVILGTLLLLNIPLCFHSLDSLKAESNEDEKENENVDSSFTYSKLLMIPTVTVACFILCLNGINADFWTPYFQVHLLTKNVSQFMITFEFFCHTISSIITSVIVGRVLKEENSLRFIFIGLIVCVISFNVIDTSAIIGFNIYITSFAMCFTGIGVSMISIATVCFLLKIVREMLGNEGDRVTSMICALRCIFIAFGRTLGPSLGGVLYDNFGFLTTTSIITGINIIGVISMVLVTSKYLSSGCNVNSNPYEQFN